MPCVAAAAKIGRARSMLSSMLQLMFLREKVSLAATNTATSSACAASAASNPFMLGVSTGYRTPGLRRMRVITSAASAICGTHFGETNAVASTAGNPAARERVDQRNLDVGRHDRLFVLQAVARPDFDQTDRRRAAVALSHGGSRCGVNSLERDRRCRSPAPRARAAGSSRRSARRNRRRRSPPTYAASA